MQDPYPTSLEARINATLRKYSPTKTLLLVLTAAVVLATASILFIFHQSWDLLSVGSITTPAGLEMKTEIDPGQALQQLLRDRQFLDSIERFGIEGVEELRLNTPNK